METIKPTQSSSLQSGATKKIRVWDLPTRVFHWMLVLCMIGLIVTGNVGGNAMVWHFRLGYMVASLILFRIVWGVLGGYWSRFAQFIYAPSRIMAYIKGESTARELVGHNPLGALSVFALLGLLSAQVVAGLFSDDEIANVGPLARFVSAETSSLATFYHSEVGKFALIALVALHVASVYYYLFKKKNNLIRPMVIGDKEVLVTAQQLPQSLDHTKSRLLALVIWLCCLALTFGVIQWVDA